MRQPQYCDLGKQGQEETGEVREARPHRALGAIVRIWVLIPRFLRVVTSKCISVGSPVSFPLHALILYKFYHIKPHPPVSLLVPPSKSLLSKPRLENEGQRTSNESIQVDPNLGTNYILKLICKQVSWTNFHIEVC